MQLISDCKFTIGPNTHMPTHTFDYMHLSVQFTCACVQIFIRGSLSGWLAVAIP